MFKPDLMDAEFRLRVIEVFQKHVKEKKLSLTKMAHDTGLSRETVCYMVSFKTKKKSLPLAASVARMVVALGVSPQELSYMYFGIVDNPKANM